MLNRILIAGLALSGLFAPLMAQDCAFPVHPGVLEQSQPDGTRVRLRFAGNAFAHWYEDEQGYPVLATAGGYMYAQPDATGTWISTGIRVGSADPATLGAQPGQIPQAPQGLNRPPQWNAEHGHDHAPTTTGSGSVPQPQALPGALAASSTGTVKNLVICMRFSNHGPSGQNRTLPTQSDVDKIMNAVGGDPTLAPTGSVRDHYLQGSYGLLTINSTVVAWVDVPNTETYYANANSGLTSRTWELITAGLQAADPLVNFSQFDADGDGWIDAITFLHSGYGAEWGGNDQYGTNYVNRMWSHKWEIPAWTSAEGIKVSDYNISPGLWGTSGTGPGRIGVVCHELGHFFGLPDLYDTNGSGQGIGNWCLMAGGSWGFDGSQRYPSHMSAWCKAKLGWLKPERILPGTYTAAQVETSPTVYRIDTGYPVGEYLLIENRQNVGFDAQLAQSGLCVWHVDETKGSMTQNSPNTEEGFPTQAGWPTNNKHYRVALLQADGGYDMERNLDRGDNADPYRSGGVTLIDGSTTPNLKAYQGGTIVTNGNRIDSISATGANMSFQFVNTTGPSITTTTAPIANLSTPYSLQLNSTGGTSPIVWTERAPLADYSSASQSPATFTLGGTAQNWNADEGMWAYTLPFRFPFYDQSYDRIVVSSNGFIDFQTGDAEAGNRPDWMRFFPRIAPLWDDLRTDQAGQNIFIDTSTAGQVRIRWAAAHFDSGSACNFAVRLYSDGRIRFEYGSGNTGLTPTVGISRGDSTSWNLPASLNSQSTLTNAVPMLFTRTGSQLPPGLSLSTGGLLSGTPTQTGTWTIIFRATDNLRRYAERSIVVSVGQDCNGNGISDATDIANGTSDDCDANGTPDECQPDADNDGVPNVCDGCPNDPLKTAPGVCGCGVADTDSDNDGVANCNDGCPTDPLKIAPGVCGCGVADTDSDSDGTPNCNDLCPNDPLKTAPGLCGCGVADTDSDSDGTPNCNDLCPNDPLKVAPGICGCGVADTDSDNDGVANCNDGCPTDPLKVAPGICGCGVADTDTDNDGTADCFDGCPTDPLKTAPGLCGCGVADTDSDNDGTPNCNDLCPNDPLKVAPGICGCGVADTDTDNDGTADCFDGCPTDPLKTAPGVCGCGVADTDTDSDGTPNCNDLCPNDPQKVAPGICGCGVADTDSDNDGTPNCNDLCPNDPLKVAPGVCGCGVADTDSDNDGTPNCNDLCPNDPLKVAPGVCGCGVADTDSDNDGTPNCVDFCPNDPLKISPGVCGCGTPDTDTDGDTVPDCVDNCPSVANTSQADCDADQLGDACEIAAGASDCNANTVPDACELASGSATDFNQNGVLDACEAVGLNFCFGDASGGACPCSNFGAAGRGCANSVNAQGAKLQAMGNLNPDAVVLAAQGTLPTSLCIFLQGTAAVQPVVFGDGLRCTGGALKRLSAKAAVGGLAIYPQGAELGIRARSAQLGDTIPSGALRYYQTYYRDPSGAFCAAPAGSTYNITNGVEILWP